MSQVSMASCDNFKNWPFFIPPQARKQKIALLNKKYKKNTLYYGTIKIRVQKGTDFRHRVFGWISAVLKNSKIDVDVVERKWYKLKGSYMRP